jgi:catechol-2,3-dioxygenase
MAPALQRIDHIHVHVSDRTAAERWYEHVLGLRRVAEFEFWAHGDGPLTVADASGTVHLALFERTPKPCHSTIAFAVNGQQFAAWLHHLSEVLAAPPAVEDHEVSWSLYFADPDGNPFEITTYERGAVAAMGLRD